MCLWKDNRGFFGMDWNGNGKEDLFDDFVDYQIYKKMTEDEPMDINNDVNINNNMNLKPNKKRTSGWFWVWFLIFGVLILIAYISE